MGDADMHDFPVLDEHIADAEPPQAPRAVGRGHRLVRDEIVATFVNE